jgi:hypothetical protein
VRVAAVVRELVALLAGPALARAEVTHGGDEVLLLVGELDHSRLYSIAPMRALLPIVAISAVVLTGCAKSIDDQKAEKFIAKSITEQVGAKVKRVTCPSDLTAKKGETFECTVTGMDGSSGTAKVTEKDDQGNVNVSAPFVHVRNLEQQIAGGISDQIGGSNVQVTCPEIITGAKGKVFECDATSGKDKATVAVTQTDDQGNVTYKLKQ